MFAASVCHVKTLYTDMYYCLNRAKRYDNRFSGEIWFVIRPIRSGRRLLWGASWHTEHLTMTSRCTN